MAGAIRRRQRRAGGQLVEVPLPEKLRRARPAGRRGGKDNDDPEGASSCDSSPKNSLRREPSPMSRQAQPTMRLAHPVPHSSP